MNKNILLLTVFGLSMSMVAFGATKQEMNIFNTVKKESMAALAMAEKANKEKPGQQKQMLSQVAKHQLGQASDNILDASDKIHDDELTEKLGDLLGKVDDAKLQFFSVSHF